MKAIGNFRFFNWLKCCNSQFAYNKGGFYQKVQKAQMILAALSNALSGSDIPGYKTFFLLKSNMSLA